MLTTDSDSRSERLLPGVPGSNGFAKQTDNIDIFTEPRKSEISFLFKVDIIFHSAPGSFEPTGR